MKKIFLTSLIILVAAAAFITYKRGWWEKQPENQESNIEQSQQENQVEQEEVEKSRNDIMLAISQKMNDLSPYETVGMWFPVKFWLDRNDAENQYVYVDYEDGHYMYRMLVEVLEVDNGLEFSIIGKFELGEDEWELKEGADTLYGKIFDIYNWNPDTNQAEKVN